MPSTNPFLTLPYEPAFASLGSEFSDPVEAATFPAHQLRFRNDRLLPILGLDPATVTDEHFIEAFGRFQGRSPLLAMRYHGYQFGIYNPDLGDGRGFSTAKYVDATAGSTTLALRDRPNTPYSRGGDGKLTLKGGVREVLASEFLQRLGVRTGRCLSLIETGEELWRGDEPSPTRSSVMVRFNRTHIRFGTFERLHYFKRADLVRQLLDHVIATYYSHLLGDPEADAKFYAELTERTADLAAQWMAAGFCHAVLNTDNLSIVGESFDYGPWAFLDRFDPKFTAAYFDHSGRYRYENQPGICQLNLELLQVPLGMVMSAADLEAGIAGFGDRYQATYSRLMLRRLGFEADQLHSAIADDLIITTLQLLLRAPIGYNEFFARLRAQFQPSWRSDLSAILPDWITTDLEALPEAQWQGWRDRYHQLLTHLPESQLPLIQQQLAQANPEIAPIRPVVESVWDPIAIDDNWEPLEALLNRWRHDGDGAADGVVVPNAN
nr:unknown [Synechococcus elongatus PCC 7942 = FACHB-805]